MLSRCQSINVLVWLISGLAAFAGTETNQDLLQLYANQGELLLLPLASAPFPHPQRAEGHKYKDELFSAQDHYSDSTVAIFVPKGFRETGRIDFVIHFHGWRNHVADVLKKYRLIEQLVESELNAVLVVPQGPRDAPDSFGGKLEDPGGFKRFMNEVTETLRTKCGLKRRDFTVGRIVLSGHSGGYQVIASSLDHGGMANMVKEVWLFDALYARTSQFLDWADQQHGRLLNIYTEHGGTKAETENLMTQLKQRGTPFLAGKEADLTPAELQKNKMIFLYTDLPHDDVVAKHDIFRLFLETSCLERRRNVKRE